MRDATDPMARRVVAENRALARRLGELERRYRIALSARRAARAEQQKWQLAALRLQLNPHFLLNALSSIHGLILPLSRRAGLLVMRLAEFCRSLLASHERQRSLREEIEFLRVYLEIEQTRWQDRLQVEIVVQDGALGCLVPAFLLLPLAENAIKYGIASSRSRTRVRLTVRAGRGGRTIIEVANTGEWRAGLAGSTRVGLANLRQRLRGYRQGHKLSFAVRRGWVVAVLRLTPPKRNVRPVPTAPPPA